MIDPSGLIVPPHSEEAEWALLGCLLADPHALERVGRIVPAQMYSDVHRRIMQAVLDAVEVGEPHDAISVAERLDSSGDLERIGGLVYLGTLVSNAGAAANVQHYARVIREKAQERELLAIGTEIAELAHSPIPTREKVDAAQAKVMAIGEANIGRAPVAVATLREQYLAMMAKRRSGTTGAIVTHIPAVDHIIHGMEPGELVIVAGRPSMGKSAFAFQVGESAAMNGKTVLIQSMEMSNTQAMDRLVAGMTGIGIERLRKGEQSPHIDAAFDRLNRVPLYIDDSPALTVMEIRQRARRVKRQHGLDLLVVDYLQLMAGRGENRNAIVNDISRGLKSLAMELSIPVIALSQLSRECERRADRRPMLSDLRESGGIEQDADLVLFVYREEVYQPDSGNWKGLGEILVRKHRQGRLGDAKVSYKGDITRFGPLNRDWPVAAETSGRPFARRQEGADQ